MPTLSTKLAAPMMAVLVWFAPTAGAITPFEVAQKELGISEDTHPERVVEYLHSVDPSVSSPETAWCSAFMNFVVKTAGAHGASDRLDARSWLQQGRSVAKPRLGDIVILWRGSPDSWMGHVGFFVEENSTHVRLLSGNSNDRVEYAWYSKNRLLGYRRLED